MFNETVCLENLKHIVSESADDQHIKTLSLDELRSTYAKITDNIYRISVFNCHTYKNMLWNLDNLKHEIRSKFQKELFDTWHSVYLKTMKTDMPAERPEVEAKEQAPDTVTHPPMESQKEKKGRVGQRCRSRPREEAGEKTRLYNSFKNADTRLQRGLVRQTARLFCCNHRLCVRGYESIAPDHLPMVLFDANFKMFFINSKSPRGQNLIDCPQIK